MQSLLPKDTLLRTYYSHQGNSTVYAKYIETKCADQFYYQYILNMSQYLSQLYVLGIVYHISSHVVGMLKIDVNEP